MVKKGGRNIPINEDDDKEYTPNQSVDIPDIRQLVEVQISKYPPTANYILDSTGEKIVNGSVYLGSGGNLYLFWRLNKMIGGYDGELRQAISTCLEIPPDQPDAPSFLMGSAGCRAIIGVHLQDESHIRFVVDQAGTLDGTSVAHELLYGTAGYIYCLLFILKYWPACSLREEIIAAMERAVAINIEATRFMERLQVKFYGITYFGGAHGLLGNVYMLLQAREYISEDYDDCILNSLTYILSMQTADGNFPIDEESMFDEDKVQWCHGAPGAVQPLLKAYQIFGDMTYLEAAKLAGECIWAKGMCLKGLNLCHGVPGNAYPFLNLFNVTRNQQWLMRAYQFTHKMFNDPEFVTPMSSFVCRGRKVRGVSDEPYSLLTGQAGLICFLLDLQHPETALFPGYDV